MAHMTAAPRAAKLKLNRELKVRVDETLDERIRSAAHAEFLDASDIVRRALRAYFGPQLISSHGKGEL